MYAMLYPMCAIFVQYDLVIMQIMKFIAMYGCALLCSKRLRHYEDNAVYHVVMRDASW
jgi:hypothetical protein